MPPYYSILPLAAGSPDPLINLRSPLVVQSDRIPSKGGWRVESLGGATVHLYNIIQVLSNLAIFIVSDLSPNKDNRLLNASSMGQDRLSDLN